MSRKKKWLIAIGVVLVGAATAGANFYFKRETSTSVTVEALKNRNLTQLVTASGKIQAKRFVNISAVQMGRVTKLAVEEGDRVKAGQLLLEIDPNTLRGTVQRGEAAVEGARADLRRRPASMSRPPRRICSSPATTPSVSATCGRRA